MANTVYDDAAGSPRRKQIPTIAQPTAAHAAAGSPDIQTQPPSIARTGGQMYRTQRPAQAASEREAPSIAARLPGAAQRRQAREIPAPTDLFGHGGSGTGGRMARARTASPVDTVEPSPSTAAPPKPVPAIAAPSIASPAQQPRLAAAASVQNQPRISDTNIAGIKRVDGINGAPNMFTDNPDRAIADASSSAAGLNRTAARQAQDGRLNAGSASVPASAAGLQTQDSPDFQVRGLDGRSVSAAESGYRPGGIMIGSSDPRLTPGDRNFDPMAFRASLRSRELDQRGAADQQSLELQREDLAERRAARIGDIDPNRFRLTAAQAGLTETQASQAQQLQQLSNQLATEQDPARRAQLQETLLALQGKSGAGRQQSPLRVKVPTEAGRQVEQLRQQLLQETDPARRGQIQSTLMAIGDAGGTQDAIYDPNTGQTTVVGAGPSASAGTASPPPSQNHISALRRDPKLAAQFDEIYGAGAAARAVGGA